MLIIRRLRQRFQNLIGTAFLDLATSWPLFKSIPLCFLHGPQQCGPLVQGCLVILASLVNVTDYRRGRCHMGHGKQAKRTCPQW